MQQSRTHKSGMSAIVKVVLAGLLSLLGLTVVGAGQAYGAAPVLKTINTLTSGATGPANGGGLITIGGSGFLGATSVTFGGVAGTGRCWRCCLRCVGCSMRSPWSRSARAH